MKKYSPLCAAPSKKYPQGRTGTTAGYQWHRAVGEPPCAKCFNALKVYNKSRRPSITPDFSEITEGLKCSRPSLKFPEGRTGTGAGYGVHQRAGEPPCGACRDARIADRRAGDPAYQVKVYWSSLPACHRPTSKYPKGRTGTGAGYQAHLNRGEAACEACLIAQSQAGLAFRYASAERLANHRVMNNAAAKKWREKNPDAVHKLKHEWIDRNRAFAREAKDRPCADCGVRYPYYVMEFDHLDPGAKTFNVSAGVTSVSYARLVAEIEKCDVVCANCHAERTHQRKKRREEANADALE